MATREKTVTFAFPMATSLVADAVVTNLSQITLYIPEASPVFTSVSVEVGFQDVITLTGGTINEHRVGLRLGAASYTTFTETNTIVNTGEQMAGVIGPIDFTAHFNTNWSGTSKTCDLQVYFDQNSGTTLGMANVTALVYVTYTYDDTAATQIKTVRVPMENLGALATTETQIGTNQIPQLTGGGILPEAGVTIRDWFIVAEANEANNGNATDWTLSFRTDTDTTYNCMTQEQALQSDRFCRWIYRPASPPSASAAHQWKAWATTARATHMTFVLYVTYEFTLSGTSRVLNSILLPIEVSSPLGSTGTGQASRYKRSLLIAEPGTITLRQSGFRINFNTAAGTGSLNFRAGSQAYQSFAISVNVVCGMLCFQKRIDAASAGGAGVSLARGMNDIVVDGYTGSATVDITNVSGLIILNYESDLAPGGIGAHNHTVFKELFPWDAALTDVTTISGYSFPIPETDYYLASVGFLFNVWQNAAANALTFDCECLSGEGKGGGYYDIYADAYQSDAERSCTLTWARGRDLFKRFPADVGEERLDIETARAFRFYSPATSSAGIMAMVTVQSMTWNVAGSISGNDAALPSEVELVMADTGEVRQRTTLTAGTTAFNFTVNDDTEDYFVSVYQDGTHVGRSDIDQAA